MSDAAFLGPNLGEMPLPRRSIRAALIGIFHDGLVRDAIADEIRALEPVKEDA